MRFEALRETLLRAGIAPRRVRRYLNELTDHLAGLTEAQQAAGYTGEDAGLRARALLGSDAELAAAWLARSELRSVAARFPWAVFLLLPPLAMVPVMFLPALSLIAIAKANQFLVGAAHAPQWYRLLAAGVATTSNLAIGPLVALLFAGMAWRQRLSPLWALAGGIVILLAAPQMHVGFVDHHHTKGSISVGFAPVFDTRAWHALAAQWPLTLARWALTLMPAAWLVWRRHPTAD